MAKPPVAPKRPRRLVAHGHVRTDDYFWLRDDTRSDPEVLAYLEAENAYTKSVLAHTEPFQGRLHREIVSRLVQEDVSVPYRLDDYWYYHRFEKGKEYAVHARKRGNREGREEILLDANALARDKDYYHLGGLAPSPDHGTLAYADDTAGRMLYAVHFKDLGSGQTLEDRVEGTSGALAWATDSRTVFYIRKHPQTLLPYQVFRHVVGTDPREDELVYEESDDTFYTSVYNTRSRDYVVIRLTHTLSTEIRLLAAEDPTGSFRIFLPREPDHEYDIDQVGERFYVRTNWKAVNFRLMETRLEKSADREGWKEIVPHRPDVLLEDFAAFRDYLALNEREEGLLGIRILGTRGAGRPAGRRISSDEPVYVMQIDHNPDPASDTLRYSCESLIRPHSVYDVDMRTGKRTLLKQEEVVGDFDPSNYRSERLWAEARDGKRIPISLVCRPETVMPAPLYLEAYGAYGYSNDPNFVSHRLSLLDRGCIFAIAHVRGGQELGRQWYESGRLLQKQNTFQDFIDATECLIRTRRGDPEKIMARGGSAGGLLAGAVVNARPDLYRAVVARVPFVDVVTTMLDDSIPLTSAEYDEWGDPHEEKYYRYMLSYSPYDQVAGQAYPHMLVTAGLHDSQVQYWEPAKWVARLRAHKTDANRLLLHVNMDAGHMGRSGRFRRYREVALEYAFLLDILGIRE